MVADNRHGQIAATLQGIVGRVLRIEPRAIDIEAPFLELGADSLALVEALRGLQETFGVKMTIRQLFEQFPTISALAGFLDQTLPAEPHPPAPSPAGEGENSLRLRPRWRLRLRWRPRWPALCRPRLRWPCPPRPRSCRWPAAAASSG